jgi:hypothetical protein
VCSCRYLRKESARWWCFWFAWVCPCDPGALDTCRNLLCRTVSWRSACAHTHQGIQVRSPCSGLHRSQHSREFRVLPSGRVRIQCRLMILAGFKRPRSSGRSGVLRHACRSSCTGPRDSFGFTREFNPCALSGWSSRISAEASGWLLASAIAGLDGRDDDSPLSLM